MDTDVKRIKIKIKIKKKELHDEYVITDKCIIYKFKFVVLCFDPSAGLVMLSCDQLKELLADQEIIIDSNSGLKESLEQLRDWHPSISKIEVDLTNVYETDGLPPNVWDQYAKVLKAFKYNQCVNSAGDFQRIANCAFNVVDVNVSFTLTRKIHTMTEYQINPKYLRKLLTQLLIPWNNEFPPFFDEISVTPEQLPFGPIDKPTYVYPYMFLLPLGDASWVPPTTAN